MFEFVFAPFQQQRHEFVERCGQKLKQIEKSQFSHFERHVLFRVKRNDIDVVKRDFAVLVLILYVFVLKVFHDEMCIIRFQIVKHDLIGLHSIVGIKLAIAVIGKVGIAARLFVGAACMIFRRFVIFS